MNTARNSLASAGTQTEAIGFGGNPGPAVVANTEQFNGTSWISVPPMSTAREALGGAGTQTAGFRIWWLYNSKHNSHRRMVRPTNYSNRFNLDNILIKYYILLNDREEKYKEFNTARRSSLKQST
jgi:hypothetical protein